MSLRVMAVSGLAVAGLLLTMPAAQAVTPPLPTPAQLTGTQLASRLLPPSSFPSGYKIVKSGTYNSGGRLEPKQTLSATGLFTTINDTLATVSGRDVVIIDAAGQKVPAKPALPTAVA